MIAARLADWRHYFQGPVWESAFAFLEQLPVGSPDNDGLVPIPDSALRYRVMSYPTRGPEGGVIEAHDTHVDIQMSLVGAEAIDWYERSGLVASQPYDAENDYVLFEKPGSITGSVINAPGYFSVYFPEDAHMAQQMVGGVVETVRKVVIKVPLSLVRPAR